jgi:transposase-like protein
VSKSRSHDWDAIRHYYEQGHTVRQCCGRFGLSARAWQLAVRGGLLPTPPKRRLLASEKRALIDRMFQGGYSQAMIAAELGMSKATVGYHARRFGLPVRDDFARRYDWAEVQRAYDAGASVSECARRFGFCKASWTQAVARGDVVARPRRLPLDELLIRGKKRGRFNLKARLVEAGLKENRCERCGINEWRGKPLNMQLHHINGDGLDNRLENLELLCANCHSQTSTYGGRNGHRRGRSMGDAEAA